MHAYAYNNVSLSLAREARQGPGQGPHPLLLVSERRGSAPDNIIYYYII